jgi:hypothetical protein
MFLISLSLQWLLVLSLSAASALTTSPKKNIRLLPKPSGPYAVAINPMELTDVTRRNLFGDVDASRRIMVSAIYPVKDIRSSCHFPYMPPFTAAYEESADTGHDFPKGSLESLYLQVGCRKEPIEDTPVVIFCPASGSSRLEYSYLASNNRRRSPSPPIFMKEGGIFSTSSLISIF